MNVYAAGCVLLAMIATGAWSARTDQPRPPREDPNAGPSLYRTYCASCHGADGRGSGVATKALHTQPPDLTRIAERHGGAFPSGDVARAIDGRNLPPGHQRDEMPRWGVVLWHMEMKDEQTLKAASTPSWLTLTRCSRSHDAEAL